MIRATYWVVGGVRLPSRAVVFMLAILVLMMPPRGSADGRQYRGPVEAESLAGKLLVAGANMRDPRFHKTVIFMARHDRNGAFGIIINRPIGSVPVAEALRGFGREAPSAEGDLTIHYGGPVEQRIGFFVHSDDHQSDNVVGAHDGIVVTADPGVLQAIAGGGGPKRYLFALGYAGWGPGQLEGERARDAWEVAPGDADLVFSADAAGKWDRAMAARLIDL